MSPKANIVPPGGFHFVDRSNGEEHRIVGSSYQDVAEQVLRYRLANKLPVGQPLDEVFGYVCNNWPHFCSSASVPVPSPVSVKPSFTVGVMQWMARLWERQAASPRQLVSDTEAARRANICRGCPLQKDWADYGCASCVSSIRQKGYVFRAGRETGLKGVTGCRLLVQDNTTAVFADLASLPDVPVEVREQMPNNCWRKNNAA